MFMLIQARTVALHASSYKSNPLNEALFKPLLKRGQWLSIELGMRINHCKAYTSGFIAEALHHAEAKGSHYLITCFAKAMQCIALGVFYIFVNSIIITIANV